jgi:hypothetical protein
LFVNRDSVLAASVGLWQFSAAMSVSAAIVEPPRIPAPPDLVARAEALVKKYDSRCFWFRHPEARVKYMDDVELVIHHLREYGNHEAWKEAQELHKCL